MVMINWRQVPRFSLYVPLWIRPMDSSQTRSQRAETLNFSASRLCMLTGLPFLLGEILERFLKMPAEIVGGIKRECVARAEWFAWDRGSGRRIRYALAAACREQSPRASGSVSSAVEAVRRTIGA
jgi:hypothetical protein